MANMESPSPLISTSLSLLEEQEKEYKIFMNTEPLKDHILSLKLGLQSLQTFDKVSSNEDFRRRINSVDDDVKRQLQLLSGKPVNESLVQLLDDAYSDLREKMKNVIINPENGEYDSIFAKFFKNETNFKRIYDFVLKSFEDLSSYKTHLINAPSIKGKLVLLQSLLTYVSEIGVEITEENEKLLTPFVALLDKAACLVFFCLVCKMDEEMELAVKKNLSNLFEKNNLREIYLAVFENSKLLGLNKNLLEIETYFLEDLIKLLDRTSNLVIYKNGVCEKLHDKLKFVRTFLVELPHEVKLEKATYLVPSIKAITSTASHILSSSYDKYMKDDDVTEISGQIGELIDQIEFIQEEVKEIKVYNYPKTDELDFLDLFLGRVEELFIYRPELITIHKNQIKILKDEFDSLGSFLKKIKEQNREDEEVKDLGTSIIQLAYQAELVIDCYLVKSSSDHRIEITLSKIMEKIKLIQSEVTRINNSEKYVTRAHNVTEAFSDVPSDATETTTDEVVGLEDEVEKILEYVLGGQKQLDVISIVGMPGLGKTTLAKKIHNHSSVLDRFDVQAWCTISQTYRKREVLLTLLGHIITDSNEIIKLDDQELVEKLCKCLRGRRYLIVIDDLWDIVDWNDLKRSFPIENNHSRILITTRLKDVAMKTKVNRKVHYLRPLYDDETWELLKKKLFQNETYSEDFQEVGKLIAKNCKGLPLTIVVTAGLLRKVEKNILEWNKIAGTLNSHVFSDSETQCKVILDLSYNHLPDHLKSCFLYLGAFAEDDEISVKKLKWLWISEGFVRNTNILDDLAQEYFMDLVNRSLLTVSIESSLGKVKTCRVHDLIHDFCLVKAQEDNFMQVIRVDNASEFSGMYEQRRLKIFSGTEDLLRGRAIGFTVRSLLHTAVENSSVRTLPISIDSFAIWNFKLLRVLDLTSIFILEHFSSILLLIHLRYLAITATEVPSSISNLWNLQFLLVKAIHYFHPEGVCVPDSLWDMVNLRYVHIDKYASFVVPTTRIENSGSLSNLESLSTPYLRHGKDADNLLKRLPKLRKLSCIFLECWDDSSKCYRFPELEILDQLISLKVDFKVVSYSNRCVFNFPSNLQKLTLSNVDILEDDISEIGRSLPNLKVLKFISFPWPWQWIVNDGTFPKLKYLKLRDLYLSNWIASDDSFPVLEQLVLDDVSLLSEIPSCFEEIPTLQMITVKKCKKSVDDSARRIETEQHEELQNLEFKVHIYPSKERSTSTSSSVNNFTDDEESQAQEDFAANSEGYDDNY